LEISKNEIIANSDLHFKANLTPKALNAQTGAISHTKTYTKTINLRKFPQPSAAVPLLPRSCLGAGPEGIRRISRNGARLEGLAMAGERGPRNGGAARRFDNGRRTSISQRRSGAKD